MLNDVIKQVKRYWMPDSLIDWHIRELQLSVYDFAVYAVHCRHANKEGITFVGVRRVASLLGISPSTAHRSVKRLEACRLLVRLDKNIGRASYIKINPVPLSSTQPSQVQVPKELEVIKEVVNKYDKFDKLSPKEILKRDKPEIYKQFYRDTP